MVEKKFDVMARLRVKNATEFKRNMRGAGIHVKRAAKHMRDLRRTLGGLGTVVGLGGLAALAMGVRRLATDLVKMPEAANAAKRGLGVLIQQNFGVPQWSKAKLLAEGLRDRLIDISNVSPGGIDDYMGAVRDLGVMAKGSGIDLEQLANLTRNVVAIEKLSGLQQGVVSRDVRQLLSGLGAQIQTPQLIAQRLKIAGLAREGKKGEAMGMITKALQLDQRALAEFGQSWDAQIDTVKTRYKRFMEMAGKPVLGHLTELLRQANVWLSKNQARVKEFAQFIAQKGVAAIQAMVMAVKWVHENWSTIVDTIKTMVTVWIAAKGIQAIKSMTGAVGGLLKAVKFASKGFGGLVTGIAAAAGAAVVGVKLIIAARDAGLQRRIDEVNPMIAQRHEEAVKALMSGNRAGAEQAISRGGRLMMERRMQEIKQSGGIKGVHKALRHFAPTMQGSIDTFVKRVHADYSKRYDARTKMEEAQKGMKEAVQAAADNGLTQNVDMRGSRVEVRQDFRQSDPDAVFFSFVQGIGQGVVRTASRMAPRLT